MVFIALTLMVIGNHLLKASPITAPPIAQYVLFVLMSYTPTIAALASGLPRPQVLPRPPLRPNRYLGWLLFALFVPPVLSLGAFLLAGLFPGIEYARADELPLEILRELQESLRGNTASSSSPNAPALLVLARAVFTGILYGATLGALISLGEEIAWRGFLYEILAPLGFWRSSFAIGVIWGLWHAPSILYQEHGPLVGRLAELGMRVGFTVLIAPLFTLVRQGFQSPIGTAILHGTLNETWQVSLLVRGGGPLTVGLTGGVGLSMLVVVNLGLWGIKRHRSERNVQRGDLPAGRA